MNPLFRLKLLLIKHGKCSACLDKKAKYCGRCFNTRLEPEVLEAITVLDLATKFEQCEGRVLQEEVLFSDYIQPCEGSYFAMVRKKKRLFERLYQDLITSNDEKQTYEKLMQEILR